MKKLFKVLIAVAMSAVFINPPDGNLPGPFGKPIPIPGQPPIIVVFPSGNN